MNFSDRFKSFLKFNTHLLDQCKFDDFYTEFKYFGCPETTCTLTILLLTSGIDPINYFSYIPDKYASSSEYAFGKINLVNNDKLQAIGQFAFYYCENLNSILLPECLEKVCMHAFMFCNNLREVRLPSTLTTIEKFSFHGCKNLTDISFMGTVEEWKDKVKKDDVRNIFYKVPARKIKCIDGWCSLRV